MDIHRIRRVAGGHAGGMVAVGVVHQMVYENLTKTRRFVVEARGKGFSIVEYRKGRKPKFMSNYPTRAEAEDELRLFAYDGFRRVE